MGEAGGGNAHHAASPEDAPAILAKEFDDLVSLVAQNVSVEIRVSDHVKVLGILNGFPSIEVPGSVQVGLGDAYGDETRRVLFAMHVSDPGRDSGSGSRRPHAPGRNHRFRLCL